MVIIVTWEKMGKNVFDAGFVLNEKDEPMVFDSIDEASIYADRNDDKIGSYYKYIDEI